MAKPCILPSCVANIYSRRFRWNEKPPSMHLWSQSEERYLLFSWWVGSSSLCLWEGQRNAFLSFVSFHAILCFLLLYPQLVAISGEKSNDISRACSPDCDPVTLLGQQKTQHTCTQTAANAALSGLANVNVCKVGELRQPISSWKYEFCLLKCS